MHKSVKVLLPAAKIDMGGFPVKQALPTQQIDQVDPFLLLHHAQTKYSDKRPARHQGVDPHPHRGFSPVTFVIDGEVQHRDSRGNNQIAKKGEVQWIYAGAGIIHSERPSEALLAGTRRQEIVQLWINSPASQKMIPPQYHYLSRTATPVFLSGDQKVENKLIAGEYQGKKGKIPTQSDLLIIWSEGRQDGQMTFQVPEGFNSTLYLIKGQITIKGYGLVEAENLVVFNLEGTEIELTLKENNSEFLLLCGKPLDEKVTRYGPYVMNTQTEILEAMRDFQMGKMGILIED
jgi:hypothetical protein